MHVDLDTVVATEPDALREPPVEPRALLWDAPGGAVLDEGCDGPVHVALVDQQIDVGERAQRRVDLVQVGDRRSLDDEELDTTSVAEPGGHLEQAHLELQAPQHRSLVRGDGLVQLLVRQLDGPVSDRPEHGPQQTLRGRPGDERRRVAGVESDAGAAGGQADWGQGGPKRDLRGPEVLRAAVGSVRSEAF